jgi:recombination protein RecR
VVEQPEDIAVIEGTHEFHGLFHVLGGVISPLDGIGPDRLFIDALVKRVEKEGIRELILAMNPTVQGDTTALYLASLFRERGIVLTRLASGIPVGGDLGYADRLTLARSLRGRIPY